MRFSNWCTRHLTEDQLHYAGQDALMAVKVFAKLGQEYLNLPTNDARDEMFWNSMYVYVRPYLNRKHDAERVQSKKAAGEGGSTSKRKGKKEDVEDSSSDVDMDWSMMNETCSNRDAVLFFPEPYVDETGQLKQNKNVVAAISPILLSLCDKNEIPPVTAKVDSGKKRYIVKMTLKKINKTK